MDRWLDYKSDKYATGLKGAKSILLAAMIFILVTAYKCGDRIGINLALKYENALAMRIQPGDPFGDAQKESDAVLSEVRGVVGNSSPLHFMLEDGSKEFLFYQSVHGNSAFFYPTASWIFVKDMLRHAQSLLDNGDYLLVDQKHSQAVFATRLSDAQVIYVTKNGQYVLLSGRHLGSSEKK